MQSAANKKPSVAELPLDFVEKRERFVTTILNDQMQSVDVFCGEIEFL